MKPLVSVCMITYNQERYIEAALEGVFQQEIDFPLEIIISDDCSLDKTPNLIKELISKEKNISIRYFRQKKNLGMIKNFIFGTEKCQGKYIAFCEGDDCWIDSHKLKKQIDFLERNNDFGICFHRVKIYHQEEDTFIKDEITREVPVQTGIEDLAKGNFMHTPSVVLRNNFNLPRWFKKATMGDWSLYMVQIKDQKIQKFDEEMAIYRIHDKGVWSSKSQEIRNQKTVENVRLLINEGGFDAQVLEILMGRVPRDVLPQKRWNYVKKFIHNIFYS